MNHWVQPLRVGLVERKLAGVPPLPGWGVPSVNNGVRPLRVGWVDQKFAGVPPLPGWGWHP